MPNEDDDNYVSIWFWLLAFFIMAIPIVNLVMILVRAFAGNNQSRKNYFRAIILIWVLLIGLIVAVILLGSSPMLIQELKNLKLPWNK